MTCKKISKKILEIRGIWHSKVHLEPRQATRRSRRDHGSPQTRRHKYHESRHRVALMATTNPSNVEPKPADRTDSAIGRLNGIINQVQSFFTSKEGQLVEEYSTQIPLHSKWWYSREVTCRCRKDVPSNLALSQMRNLHAITCEGVQAAGGKNAGM